MTLERKSDELSLVERINASRETLGVSRREVMDGLKDLADVGDLDGIKELFDAYLTWETKSMSGRETQEETLKRCRSNFDVLAKLTDQLPGADGDEYVASLMATSADCVIGVTATAFRDAVDYHPENTSQGIDIDSSVDTGNNR